jgi:hypothetical protein
MSNRLILSTAIAISLTSLASATPLRGLLVPDFTGDRVMLLSREDGTAINPFLINDTATGMPALSSPKKAKRVGHEIWVSDQLENCIRRYSLDGTTYLGNFADQATQGIQNVRGFEVAFGRVYIACDSGTFADKVAILDFASGTVIGAFSLGTGHWDILRVNGELLVSEESTDDIFRVDANGAILGRFVDSTSNAPLDWPQGMVLQGDRVVVGCFNTPLGGPFKVFDLSGNLLTSFVTSPQNGLRGAFILDNGNYLWTNGSGVVLYDRALAFTNVIIPGTNMQFINTFNDCVADFNDDGTVDFFDYLDFVDAFTTSC